MNKQYKVKPWYTDPKEANLSAQDVQDMLNFSVECGAKGVEWVRGTECTYVNINRYPLSFCKYWGLTNNLYTHTKDADWRYVTNKTINKVSSLQDLKDLFSEGIEQENEAVVVEDRYKFLEGVGDTELRVIELLLINYNKTPTEDSTVYFKEGQAPELLNKCLIALEDTFSNTVIEANTLYLKTLLTKEELTQLQNKTKIEALAVSIKSQQEELDKLKQGLNCGTNL